MLTDHHRHAHAIHHRPSLPRSRPAVPCRRGAVAPSIAVAPHRALLSCRAVHHRPVHCCQVVVVPSIAVESITVESPSHSSLLSIAVHCHWVAIARPLLSLPSSRQSPRMQRQKKTWWERHFSGRLDRINYARAIKYHFTNTLDGKGRRHTQHNTGPGTKTERKGGGLGTINCSEQKCNTNDCEKRGLTKWQQMTESHNNWLGWWKSKIEIWGDLDVIALVKTNWFFNSSRALGCCNKEIILSKVSALAAKRKSCGVYCWSVVRQKGWLCTMVLITCVSWYLVIICEI